MTHKAFGKLMCYKFVVLVKQQVSASQKLLLHLSIIGSSSAEFMNKGECLHGYG